MSKYDFELDIYGRNSLSIIIEMLTKKSAQVLEFGPAHGRLTKYLKEQKNYEVDIIEIDTESGQEASKFARQALFGEELGNIENYKWENVLANEKYDYIIFADVLEHLYNPELVLKKAKRLLKDDGEIIVSIPNIAHNSVIIDLINDKFTYTEVGLLDNTHIRFFTYNSLKDMIARCELVPVIEEATYAQVDGVFPGIRYDNIQDLYVQDVLRNREKGNVFQFIFKLQKQEVYQKAAPLVAVNIDGQLHQEAVFYIKQEDSEYSELKSIRKKISGTNNRIKIDLSSYNNVTGVRFDPYNSSCLVKIDRLLIYDKDHNQIDIDLNELKANSSKKIEEYFSFDTNDPQIEILLKEGIIKLEVEYQVFKLYNEDLAKSFIHMLEEKTIALHKVIDGKTEKLYKATEDKTFLLQEKDELQKTCVILMEKNKDMEEKKEQLEECRKVLEEKNLDLMTSIKQLSEDKRILELSNKEEKMKSLDIWKKYEDLQKNNEKLSVDHQRLLEDNQQLFSKNQEFLNENNKEKQMRIETEKQIEKIYNSRSWKILKKIKKIFGV